MNNFNGIKNFVRLDWEYYFELCGMESIEIFLRINENLL